MRSDWVGGRSQFWQRCRGAAPVIALLATLGLAGDAGMRAVSGGGLRANAVATTGTKPMVAASSTPARMSIGSYVTTQDEWAAQLRGKGYWEGRRGESAPSSSRRADPPSGRSSLGRSDTGRRQVNEDGFFGQFFGRSRAARDDNEADERPWSEGYRTVCVRLCDGYFWPISAATTRDNFASDARKCEASCGGNARLYTYSNSSGDQSDMTDLRGQLYKKLPTAFRFRETYDSQCKCKPHPWEDAATERHRMYALERRGRQDKRAEGEIKELRGKLDTAARAADANLAQHTRAMTASVLPGRGAALGTAQKSASARNRYTFAAAHGPASPKVQLSEDIKPPATIATARVRTAAVVDRGVLSDAPATVRITTPAGTTIVRTQRASVMRVAAAPMALPRVINAGKVSATQKKATR